ncbi:MAG: UvrD-helicase domain-containing protein, partial [Propionibacteriaceae bacterium]|nr:UvrD-helicase domain-containing protein [Propionibacteriaceae bacterium]
MTISLPQPGQTSVIEASAGTGKTWAISDLACRFIVGQAVPIAQLAIVTFTSAAVTEVRGRTQERLRRCAAMLTDPDPSHTNMDDESDSLWSDDPDLRRQRRDRARAALADFDHAAIMTTHGFCDHLLSLLGVLADHDQSDTLVTDLTAMITTTVADHYAQTCRTGDPRFSYEEALSWSKAALFAPSAAIVPTDRPEAAFIETVRRSVEVKKRRAGVYTFDDMLLRCRASLINPVTAQLARRRLSDAYPVLLVDEFQDTDSIQWDIIRAGFVDASTVVLIGDPKQSIYNFRGADVSAYLTATRTAQTDTLDVNHRSSPSVVEAVASLTVGLELGDPRITVKPVRTSMDTPSLVADVSESCGPWGLPLRLRVPADLTPRSVDEARRLIDADLISDLRALLDRGPSYRGSPIDPPRALRPDDVAILVATNSRGRLLLDRLAQAGVPAVFTGSGSVFDTDAARDWE